MRTRSPSLALAAALAATLGSACGPTFDPPSLVKGFRVLAVRAEAPELAPADVEGPHQTALTTLVADDAYLTEPDRAAVVIHATCTPRPGDPGGTSCEDLASLADPARLLAAGLADAAACTAPGVGKAGAITFSGVEACGWRGCAPIAVALDPAHPEATTPLPSPSYRLAEDYSFSALPAGHPDRITGLTAVDLALALDVSPAALAPAAASANGCEALQAFGARFLAAWPTAAHVAVLKRIVIRGPGAVNAPNQNPTVLGASWLHGGEWTPLTAPGATPLSQVEAATTRLLPDATGDVVEHYVKVDAAGVPFGEEDERRGYSWFLTQGDLKYATTTRATEELELKPKVGRVLGWLVVRDLRGGEAWTRLEFEVPAAQ